MRTQKREERNRSSLFLCTQELERLLSGGDEVTGFKMKASIAETYVKRMTDSLFLMKPPAVWSLILSVILFSNFTCLQAYERTSFLVPPELAAALGWSAFPSETELYTGESLFMVKTDPSHWAIACEQAEKWASDSPSIEADAAEFIFRRLVYVKTLVLTASDKKSADQLIAESRQLGEIAKKLSELKIRKEEWRMRNGANQLAALGNTLERWISVEPAGLVDIFCGELEKHRPISRAELAARYGGEKRLQKIIILGGEHERRRNAYLAAAKGRRSPHQERLVAALKSEWLESQDEFRRFFMPAQDAGYSELVYQDSDLAAYWGRSRPSERQTINVPDLVGLVGEARAEKLLIRAYEIPVQLQIESIATLSLARKLLIEEKLKPAIPPWLLMIGGHSGINARSMSELARVYDAARKACPSMMQEPAFSDWNRIRGMSEAAYALAISGRMDEGVSLLKIARPLAWEGSLTEVSPDIANVIWDLVMRSAGESTFNAKHEWLRLVDLSSALHKEYELDVYVAGRASHSFQERMVSQIWTLRHGWRLFERGRAEEGLGIISSALARYPEKGEKAWLSDWSNGLIRYLSLDSIRTQPDVIAKWMNFLSKEYKDPTSSLWSKRHLFSLYAEERMRLGDFQVVEDCLRARIGIRPLPRSEVGGGLDVSADGDGRNWLGSSIALSMLADVLEREGKHAEVASLLLLSSGEWGYQDIRQSFWAERSSVWRPLAVVVAESFYATGKTDDAALILEAYLIVQPDDAWANDLYAKIKGTEAGLFLEKVKTGRPKKSKPSNEADLKALWRFYWQMDSTPVVPDRVYPLGPPSVHESQRYYKAPRTTAEKLAEHWILRDITSMIQEVYQWKQEKNLMDAY
jgi:hypothetical protein